MSEYWIVQLINAAIVVSFGCFLMWRSSEGIHRRAASSTSHETDSPIVPEQTQKQRRVQALKAELSQLERELADISGSSSVAASARSLPVSR